MSCSMMSLRRIRFCALSRNSIAAHRTRRNRIRLMRWMMIGALTRSAAGGHVNGFRKNDSIAAISWCRS